MRRFLTALGVFLCLLTIDGRAQGGFKDFREGILKDYSAFRSDVLSRYDEFLEGIWRDYTAFRGEELYPVPKPKYPTVADPSKPADPTPLPAPEAPAPPPSGNDDKGLPPGPVNPPAPSGLTFDFYGMTVRVPEVSFDEDLSEMPVADIWRYYEGLDLESTVLPALFSFSEEHNLNDWFLFCLVREYADRIGRSPMARISLATYLLVYLNYDVRLGITPEYGPVLLVASGQMIYARTYLTTKGTQYYIFRDKSYTDSGDFTKVSTYDIPVEGGIGTPMDMMFYSPMVIPENNRKFSISDGKLSLTGSVNVNLIRMLKNYPQIPLGSYEASTLSVELRQSLVNQIKRQLSGKRKLEAVNSLLSLIQHGFDYARDEEQHGFEKPYFLEEILFYPKCDCEDRSIFYSYLLWEALGIPNHLISYPGHACVSVHLDNVSGGDSYVYGDEEFFISDPTYIGAPTGLSQPDFKGMRPTIEFIWPEP